MKTVTVTELQHDIAMYLELAEKEDILIFKNGKPIGFIRGFSNEDELFEYQLVNDPRFIGRVNDTRAKFRAGHSTTLEEVRDELLADQAPDA
jgi:hypothetical protein